MDSLNRIFQCIHEAKKGGKAMIPNHHEKAGGKKSPTGKENPYDHDSCGMQAESDDLSPNQLWLAGLAGKPNKIDAKDLAFVRKMGPKNFPRKKKVNASTEIIQVLDLLKEAYQDELISEEAFLAIADPIMRSLMNEVKYEGTSETGVVIGGLKGRTRELTGKRAAGVHAAVQKRVSGEFGSEAANPPKGSKLYYSKNPQPSENPPPPKKPQPPKNPEGARRSFFNRARRSRRKDRG